MVSADDTTGAAGSAVHRWVRTALASTVLARATWLSVLWLWAAPAAGQTITLTENRINRAEEAEKVELRRAGRRPNWISYRDCIDNRILSFPLRLSAPGNALEIWAGTDDCVQRRGQQDRGQCWPVYRTSSSVREVTALVPARAVVARQTGTDVVPTELGVSVCDSLQGEVKGEQVSFYIMQVSGGKAVASVVWKGGTDGTGFDLVGPSPPGSVKLGLGDQQLSVSLDDVTTDTDRLRFRAFCVRATPQERGDAGSLGWTPGRSDAGANDAGNSDAGDSTKCWPEVPLVAGQRPPLGGACTSDAECNGGWCVERGEGSKACSYECGESTVFQTTMSTSGLQNGQLYAVAVAGEDILGNQGPLSPVECGSPLELRDFFEIYSAQGGPGGGGLCSVVAPGAEQTNARSSGLWLLGAALSASALRAAARRHNSKRPAQAQSGRGRLLGLALPRDRADRNAP
jgi:hypothetical protein